MKDNLQRIAAHDPDTLAYVCAGEALTYGQLWQQASRTAERLSRQGVSPVVIYGHKQAWVVVSILACLICGRTYVPVDEGMPLVRVERILKATGSTLILSKIPMELPGVLCCSPEELARFDGSPVLSPESDIAYMIFTSGSTGEPKGVPIPRSNLVHFTAWIRSLPALKDLHQAKVLNQASFSFDLSVADLYYALVGGHTLVAVPKSDRHSEDIFKAMERHKINAAVVTPTFMKMCLLNRDFNETNYPDLSCVYFCGETLEKQTVRKLFRAFPHIRIINAYGPTEATSAVSAIEITREMPDEEGPLPVGDMETFATTIEIDDNEIVLKGPSVFRGYLGGLVGGWFCQDGINCYRTGDLGYFSDGLLYCKGRRDNQIKYSGYRIELSDIEENIRSLPQVEDCVVVPAYTPEGVVKSMKAFVIARDDVDPMQIKQTLAGRLPGYMIPRTIKKLDRFPVNQNGKTDRKALMQL